MFKNLLFSGVQVVCWNDGSVSEYACSYLNRERAQSDCDFLLASAAGVAGVFVQARDGSFVSAGVVWCECFGSMVRAFCS